MKIFVTGGAGFIGRHCAKSFLEKKLEVTIFDDFSNSSKNMISDLLNNGANLVKGDITNESQVTNAIPGHDIIIHLAAKTNVDDSIKHSEKTFSTNIDGTKNVLQACAKQNIKNIIAISSAAVYGETENKPISESHETKPCSPYGESKLKMELLVQDFSKKHNLNSIILRVFNAYGKGQSQEYAGVITKFIDKISKNEPLEIFGDGRQTRDFISINDIVDSFNGIISNVKGKRGSIYNIASGQSISISDLADLMISLSKKDLKIIHSPSKKGDIRFSQADITKVKNELGIFPKTTLDQGIKNLIES